MEPNIITVIKSLVNMHHLDPASSEDIALAEQMLNLKFSEEYRIYVSTYGAISARGIELTGVTSSKRLSVVDVTLREREMSDLPTNFYVVEETGIDGLLILQNQSGEIFSVAPHKPLKNVCASLADYVLRVQK